MFNVDTTQNFIITLKIDLSFFTLVVLQWGGC